MILIFLFGRTKRLIQENSLLEEQLEKVKRKYLIGNKIQKLHYNSTRIGYYPELELLPDYPTKWKNSFFYLHQDIAEELTEGNLSSNYINTIKKFRKYDYSSQNSYYYKPFVVHCHGVIPTEEGPMLCLEDPFGSIISRPLKNISLETAKSWINRMLVAYIGIHYEHEEFPINRVKTLKFTLYDEIIERSTI